MVRVAAMLVFALAAACAQSVPGDDVDASVADGGPAADAATGDAFVPPDARADAAPGATGICQACTANADCLPDHRCVLTGMGLLCLPQCSQAAPECPVGFTCGGVESTFCAPIDGVCCVDGDDDTYGEGAGCLGPDCDDLDGTINPGRAESCNDVDDDCNPATADGSGDPLVGVACDGPDTDVCTEGTSSCAVGTVMCSDATTDGLELCNGLDDDCNANTADGSDDPLVGVPCDGSDGDLCAEGLSSCGPGGVVCNDSTGTTVELCNGADDDCDSATADGSAEPTLGDPCDGNDGDLCQEGILVCGGSGLSCDDATGTTLDLCNGMDDDCDPNSGDGSEDPGIGDACDGLDSDLCEEGVSMCSMGGPVCGDSSADTLEICNTIDDDCDGTPDEDFDFQNDPATCGNCSTQCSNLCCAGGCQVASATDCGACGRTCGEVVLVINEIMINPLGVGDSVGEWFEVRNRSAFDIDLRGFVLSDLNTTPDTHTITSANPVIVAAGGYLVLGNNATMATNGGVPVGYQYSGIDLGNSGDEIIITAFGTELDRVTWTSSFDHDGKSRELSINHQNGTSNDILANWCDATAVLSGGDTGTPGGANDCSL